MSKILMVADQELQITGAYLRDWDEKTQKAMGYCALGILACQTKNVSVNGLVPESTEWIGRTFDIHHGGMYNFIKCPACEDGQSCLDTCSNDKNSPRTGNIGALIVHMNDDHGMVFKEIGKYLKKMGY